MITNREIIVNNSSVVNEYTLKEKLIKAVMFVILVMIVSLVTVYYYIYDCGDSVVGAVKGTVEDNIITMADVAEKKRNVTKQPACSQPHMLIVLQEICTDLAIKKEFCSPDGSYNERKPRNLGIKRKKLPSEPRGVPAIVNYVVGIILMASLGAALIELYKAKKQVPKKDGKCPLSRKSSLADLTVMKHQRKELIRRESIMEMPEESPHLKQLGSTTAPLQRRCSFPLGPGHSSLNKSGAMESQKASIEMRSILALDRRISQEYLPAAIIGKRHSVDDSPERRHHRLVYRH